MLQTTAAPFRLLPDAVKLEMFAYCVAMTLKPKLAPALHEEPTAVDVALSLTSSEVANYWRPTAENFFGWINREQLLASGREVLGEVWAQSRTNDKKAALVGELGRAFADPEKSGRTLEQVEKLRHWLPSCMSFAIKRPSESTDATLVATPAHFTDLLNRDFLPAIRPSEREETTNASMHRWQIESVPTLTDVASGLEEVGSDRILSLQFLCFVLVMW